MNLISRFLINYLLRAGLLAPLALLFSPFTPEAQAVSIELDGTRTVESGTDCDIATYRFGTNTSFNGTPLDILVEVLAEDNDLPSSLPGSCIFFSGDTITVDIKDLDFGENVAFMDLQITIVEQGTTTPLEVDRLSITGYDLDSAGNSSLTATDDLYFNVPDGTYLSPSSNVQFSEGSFFNGQFDAKFTGQDSGNCTDGPNVTVSSAALACRAAIILINGPSGPNAVSTARVRVQNDNAWGTISNTNFLRRFQLSFEISEVEELILGNFSDFGDAPASYGSAGHNASVSIALGNGLVPDDEVSQQASNDADADDNDGPSNANFDDEDAVLVDGQTLSDQGLEKETEIDFNVTTFGSGFLSAWIDLDRDGDFLDNGEKIIDDLNINSTTVTNSIIPITIPASADIGDSYIRFRFSENAGATPSGFINSLGEVEDYLITIEGPELILVKRITAVNGTNLTGFDGNDSRTEDENDNWPVPLATYLRGAVSSGIIAPGDEVEFTIYFLSSGESELTNLNLCDLVPDNMTFVSDSFQGLSPLDNNSLAGTDVGIALASDDTTLPTTPTVYLTNVGEGDRGEFFSPNTEAPGTCNVADTSVPLPASSNLRGAVFVQVVDDSTTLPNATAPGTPPDSYGFIRFRATVD